VSNEVTEAHRNSNHYPCPTDELSIPFVPCARLYTLTLGFLPACLKRACLELAL